MDRFEDLKNFIVNSPTPYHFAEYARKILKENEYEEIDEKHVEKVPKKGFFIRDERCLVCWNDNGHEHGSIIASHIDSPCLLVKPNFGAIYKNYTICRCSTYGGLLTYTWFGRGLRLCGKVYYKSKEDGATKSVLFDSKKPVAFIPYRPVDPLKPVLNQENDPVPLVCTTKEKFPLQKYIAKSLGIDRKQICDFDLRFVDANPPNLFSGMITGQKLDDLICAHSGFTSFLQTEPSHGVTNFFVALDNEEIGSSTHCGGMSALIDDAIKLIIPDREQRRVFKRKSFIGSFDVAHANHPNFGNAGNPKSTVELGRGICMSTDSGCADAELHDTIPLFEYINAHKDSTGINLKGQICYPYGRGTGSTVGPMSEKRTGIITMDFGQPLLAMHSIRELGSLKDLDECFNFCKKLYTMTIDEWNNFIF